MALKGNLSNFTITQLLNLINLAKKTGSIILERSGDKIEIHFKDGKLAYAKDQKRDNSLINILFQSKLITSNQKKIFTQNAASMTDKELGLLLINAEYLNQEKIINCIHTYYMSILKQLFTWEDGEFQFVNGILPPNDKITISVNLENMILESSRRMQEWERLNDEIPSLEMALKFVDQPTTNIRSLKLSSKEWRVISYINPKNTIQQIAHTTHLSELEIRRIVYGFIQAGIVELIRPPTMKQPLYESSRIRAPKSSPEQQKSLINRIIERIRSH
jgi:hypothetical protein